MKVVLHNHYIIPSPLFTVKLILKKGRGTHLPTDWVFNREVQGMLVFELGTLGLTYYI